MSSPYRSSDHQPVKKLNRRLARWFRFWNKTVGPMLAIALVSAIGLGINVMVYFAGGTRNSFEREREDRHYQEWESDNYCQTTNR